MPVKLNTASGGSVTLEPANTASNYTLTVPAQTGTVVATDSSGNVGIGTTSASAKIHAQSSADNEILSKSTAAEGRFAVDYYGAGGYGSYFIRRDGATKWRMGVVGDSSASPGLNFYQEGSGSRMFIDSSGNLLVGTTAQGNYASAITLSKDSGTNKWSLGPWATGTDKFVIAANNTYGVYLASTSAVSWSNASDERLKDIIEPITDAVNKVSGIRAVIGKYKTDEEGTRRSFLIAQDVQSVLPEAVTKMTDGEHLGISYTETIPLLVAAIQEQQAIITAQADTIASMEARLTALENK